MTRQEKFYEEYEDAAVAVIMDKIAEMEGNKYLEEYYKLEQDPNLEISDALDRKCLRTIRRTISKNNRNTILHIIRKVANKAAMAAVVALMLFSSVYALVPEFRIRTLNMLIDISDVATSLTFKNDEDGGIGTGSVDEFLGYSIPTAPEGFSIASQGSDTKSAWITYKSNEGNVITIEISGNYASVFNIDTEGADSVEQIIIHGFDGLVIEKDMRIHIVWGDTTIGKYVNVIGVNIDRAILYDIANRMRQ